MWDVKKAEAKPTWTLEDQPQWLRRDMMHLTKERSCESRQEEMQFGMIKSQHWWVLHTTGRERAEKQQIGKSSSPGKPH